MKYIRSWKKEKRFGEIDLQAFPWQIQMKKRGIYVNTTTVSKLASHFVNFFLDFGSIKALPFEISDPYHFNLGIKAHIDSQGEFKLMTSSGVVYCYLSFLYLVSRLCVILL